MINVCIEFEFSNDDFGYKLYARQQPPSPPPPPDVLMMRQIARVFYTVSQSSQSNRGKFIDAMLGENSNGLLFLIQLLEVAAVDSDMLQHLNATLYAMTNNIDTLQNIIAAVSRRGTSLTVLRWLTSALEMLSSREDFLSDVWYTDETAHPVPAGTQLTRELSCPLALELRLSFHRSTELENGTLKLTASNGDCFEFNKNNPVPATSLRINGSKVLVEYTCSAASRFGYRVDITGVFNLKFNGGAFSKYIVETGGYNLLVEQLKATDATIQGMACRAVANLMFLPESAYPLSSEKLWKADRKKVVDSALPALLGLLESNNRGASAQTPANYDTVSRRKTAVHIMMGEKALSTECTESKILYFEVLLDGTCQGAAIGLSVNDPTEATISGDKRALENCFLLDGDKGHIAFGEKKQAVSILSWAKSDCVGVLLDLEEYKITFFINGHKLSAGFQAGEHGDRELWDAGMHVMAVIPGGGGLHWNFGQSPFQSETPRGAIALLWACKGPPPILEFQKKSWMKITWKITDSQNWHSLSPEDKLVFSDEEVKADNKLRMYNLQRHLARGLYGAADSLTEPMVASAIALSAAEDDSTKKWTAKLLLRCLSDKTSPEFAGMVMGSRSAIENIVFASDNNLLDFMEVLELMFIRSKAGFKLAEDYLLASSKQDSPNCVVYESAHPYPNSANDVTELSLPGHKEIELIFHPNSSTEKNYDFVVIYSVNPNTVSGDLTAFQLSEKLRYFIYIL